MSLNGLDEAAVIEAYQAALIEPGGWFLLKYATRDTVDLLQRGSGGVVDVRIAIEQYEEKSPVYGLVQYRRRKVVLKYVPEGTSRLLQARLTVQFQSVLEKFSPHDVVFSFAAATELTESALSSACALHASVGSLNSSSSSIHRHRLGEITEDVEEGGCERPPSGLRHSFLSGEDGASEEGGKPVPLEVPATSSLSANSPLPEKKALAIPALKISEAPPNEILDTTGATSPDKTSQSPLEDRAAVGGIKRSIEQARPSLEAERQGLDSRRSLQSHRPSTSELSRSPGYNLYKPKVKLGPRPSTQRPRTAGSKGEARPISNLPNSVRISSRPPSTTSRPPSSSSYRPFSQQSNRSAHSHFATTQNSTLLPPSPQSSIQTFTLHQSSNPFVHDRPSSPAVSTTASITPSLAASRPPGITPEKQRLMRALELRRKRQMAKASEAKSSIAPVSSTEDSREPEIFSSHTASQPRQTKENSNQDREKPLAHTDRPETQMDTSTKVTVASGSGAKTSQDPAHQTDIVADRAEHSPIDSSLHSKDVEEISSTTGSDSATSEATLPSLKAANINTSPALPHVTTQDREGMNLSSISPKEDSEQLGMLADDAEKTDATIAQNSPSLKVAQQATPDGESSSHVLPKLEVNTDSKPTSTETQPQADVDKVEAGIPNTLDPRSVEESSQVNVGVEPDQATPDTDASDTSDDESLYDELQSATVEEAKPVMVARSPISAIFNKGSPDKLREHNGSVATLNRKIDESSKITPEKLKDGFGRSLSSPLPQWPSTVEPAQSLLIKKTNVSSGISKRIRALEMFTGRSEAGSSPPNPNAPPSPPPTSGLVKNLMSAHSPKEKKVRNMSINTPPAKQYHYPSPEPTPTPPPTSVEKQPSWPQRHDSKAAIFAPTKKGESISVTARIIREPSQIEQDQPNNASKSNPTNLHRSPLVVEHEKADPILQPEIIKPSKTLPSPSEEADTTAPIDIPKSGRRRFSVSSRTSTTDKLPQSESFTKRLSMTIRHARTESSNLPRSGSDASSTADDKGPKGSRRTRLMKRMSAIKTKAGSRRSIASAFGSNTLRQGETTAMASQPPDSIVERSGEVTPESSTGRSYAHVVDIGDVNIQYPDTLLWKRRFMRIDDQGYLILTPPTMEANKRGISRRFHLSDFKPPTLPSVEREELPWSIVLDFEDGSCLQCACESKYAQGQVLRLLTDAHAAYNSLFRQT